jgi:uncharacterized DUF497 family protein
MFEFDPTKSKSNRLKHGIDFDEAKILWEVPGVIRQANFSGELRWLLIAKHSGKIWSAIYTMRRQKVRLISVRRARKNEEELYRHEQEKN